MDCQISSSVVRAARLVTLSRKCEHITPILVNLHWLQVKKRIMCKLMLLTYKILNKLAPYYLCKLLNINEPVHILRSNAATTLIVQMSAPLLTVRVLFSAAAKL